MYLPVLLCTAQHHDGFALELPDHPPEVDHCLLQWGLGGDVGVTLLIALGGGGGTEQNQQKIMKKTLSA